MRGPSELTDEQGKPLPVSHCPVCGYRVEAATHVTRSALVRPRAGDLCICLKCGELLVYDENMRTRRAELKDMDNINPADEAMIGKAQELIRHNRARKDWVK